MFATYFGGEEAFILKSPLLRPKSTHLICIPFPHPVKFFAISRYDPSNVGPFS